MPITFNKALGRRRRRHCRLCGNRRLIRILALPPTPPANAFVTTEKSNDSQPCFPLDVYFFVGLLYLRLCGGRRSEICFAATFTLYVAEGTSSIFRQAFPWLRRRLHCAFPPPLDELLVDIGSNDGSLMQFFKAAGMSVLGIDPARKIAADATARGLETWPDFLDAKIVERILTEKATPRSTKRTMCCHVDDLSSLTECIRDLLTSDGVFIFEVSCSTPEHAVRYDLSRTSRLPPGAPFRPFFTAMVWNCSPRVSYSGGSLRLPVQRAGRPQGSRMSVLYAVITDERAYDLDSSIGLDRIFSRTCNSLRELGHAMANSGRRKAHQRSARRKATT